jgi:hypothetical protein
MRARQAFLEMSHACATSVFGIVACVRDKRFFNVACVYDERFLKCRMRAWQAFFWNVACVHGKRFFGMSHVCKTSVLRPNQMFYFDVTFALVIRLGMRPFQKPLKACLHERRNFLSRSIAQHRAASRSIAQHRAASRSIPNPGNS